VCGRTRLLYRPHAVFALHLRPFSPADIPSDDDNILNILEHSANTALAFTTVGTSTMAMLLTFDGYDSCSLFDPTCGINAFSMAYYLRDQVGVQTAMGMDQGGSTTMWVTGQGTDGIVSNPGQSPRNLFSGLFVAIE